MHYLNHILTMLASCGEKILPQLTISTFSRKRHLKLSEPLELISTNMYTIKLIDSCIKSFLNKRLIEKPVILTAEKDDLVIVLPFLGKLLLDLRTCLKNSISKNLPFCKIRVIFKSSTCTSDFFQFKDKMPYCLHSNIVYKFSCGRCNATYYCQTCQHLSVRLANTRCFTFNWEKVKVQKVYSTKRPYAFL